VLHIGARSGIDRPDWMHLTVATVATLAVGVELDERPPRCAGARPWRGRRGRADARSRAHRRRRVGGRAHRAAVVPSRTSCTASGPPPASTRAIRAGTTRPCCRSCRAARARGLPRHLAENTLLVVATPRW